uniref:Ig-like domain-containing protein n=1 Tax=Oreochromis niloticus TaxID=8128 RepID=I3K676_ORENI
MGHSLLCMMGFFLLSTVICGNAEEHSYDSQDTDESGYQSKEQRTSAPPKLTVFLQPSQTQLYSGVIYRGETVTLRCEIQGGEGAQWTYEWSRGQSRIHSASREYTFRSVTVSDAGGYSCWGTEGSSWTEWSDVITLTVLSPPKPTVTLQPSWTQIYSGETVTVRCEIQGGEGAQWTYEWSPAKLNTPPTSNEYTIISATESDSGVYSCRGRRSFSWTEWSDIITLNVKPPPKPTVFLQPSWTQIYSGVIYRGETVTVRCEIHGGEGAQWTYEWRRGQSSIRETSSEYTISRATWSDRGGYSCRGRRGSFWTVWSDIITMTILSPPKPTVTLQPSRTQINIGETVTVRCVIQGGERAPWTYEWRRGQKNIHETSSEYRISRLTESHGGGYSCRATRSSSWTEWSDITTLRVTVPVKPTVTLQPPWPQIYSGETVTVRCEIQGGEGAQWTYEWRPAKLNTPPTSSEYRITVTESDSGGYSCRGKRSFSWTKWSDTLTVVCKLDTFHSF